jgi:hypothetical protein
MESWEKKFRFRVPARTTRLGVLYAVLCGERANNPNPISIALGIVAAKARNDHQRTRSDTVGFHYTKSITRVKIKSVKIE